MEMVTAVKTGQTGRFLVKMADFNVKTADLAKIRLFPLKRRFVSKSGRRAPLVPSPICPRWPLCLYLPLPGSAPGTRPCPHCCTALVYVPRPGCRHPQKCLTRLLLDTGLKLAHYGYSQNTGFRAKYNSGNRPISVNPLSD